METSSLAAMEIFSLAAMETAASSEAMEIFCARVAVIFPFSAATSFLYRHFCGATSTIVYPDLSSSAIGILTWNEHDVLSSCRHSCLCPVQWVTAICPFSRRRPDVLLAHLDRVRRCLAGPHAAHQRERGARNVHFACDRVRSKREDLNFLLQFWFS